jgi:hypothetical protein
MLLEPRLISSIIGPSTLQLLFDVVRTSLLTICHHLYSYPLPYSNFVQNYHRLISLYVSIEAHITVQITYTLLSSLVRLILLLWSSSTFVALHLHSSTLIYISRIISRLSGTPVVRRFILPFLPLACSLSSDLSSAFVYVQSCYSVSPVYRPIHLSLPPVLRAIVSRLISSLSLCIFMSIPSPSVNTIDFWLIHRDVSSGINIKRPSNQRIFKF